MAATYAPGQALDYVKRMIKNMPIDQIGAQILDDTNKYMWMYAPWRWTIGTFPLITLVSSTQDYTVTIPSDFLYLQDSYINNQTGGIVRVLHVESYLPVGGKLGTPSRLAAISPVPGSPSTVRLFPQPGNVPVSGWKVISTYKKQSPLITPSNIGTPGALVMDDEWFHVYNSGCLYHAYLYGDDQRAGSAQLNNQGQVTFTGQRGVFEAELTLMKQREKIAGMDTVVPEPKEES